MYHYTNRKGVTYYLHRHTGRGGKPRYTLKRSAEGALDELPAGYEVTENVNGQVSVRRARPRQITKEEEARVRAALDQHQLSQYPLEVKDDQITIFEPDRDPGAIAEQLTPLAGMPAGLAEQLEAQVRKELGDATVDEYLQQHKQGVREQLEQTTHYAPVLRFGLIDKQRRLFVVARMTYRGDGGWHQLDCMELTEAVARYLPHLGKESFFDLV